ncbi:hypothetical protein NDU88_001656 [Pleurodeles waltl]|uniref:Uncharacterized protein n=1 Tax=Pleurodeles waltl TaxID=8319 RepID=A0AAV7SZT9_PLEWA|nr:hypothetical protein NDU88_001656 [Pleurodeles waltl]
MGAAPLIPLLRPCRLGADRSRCRPQPRHTLPSPAAAPPFCEAQLSGQARLPFLPAPFQLRSPLPEGPACSCTRCRVGRSMPPPRPPPRSPLDALGARGEHRPPPASPAGPPLQATGVPDGREDPSPQKSNLLRYQEPF